MSQRTDCHGGSDGTTQSLPHSKEALVTRHKGHSLPYSSSFSSHAVPPTTSVFGPQTPSTQPLRDLLLCSVKRNNQEFRGRRGSLSERRRVAGTSFGPHEKGPLLPSVYIRDTCGPLPVPHTFLVTTSLAAPSHVCSCRSLYGLPPLSS